MLVEGLRLRKVFRRFRDRLVAVDGVDISIDRNETLALVGESGSGKSTLGKLLLFLIEPTEGRVFFDGKEISRKNVRMFRRRLQLIPQHPESSLNPRWKILDSLLEPFRIHKLNGDPYRLVEMVGLGEEHLWRYPHELSGGELQRIAIARAIATNPEFIVCDEPTSMLDVSVQAAIVNLLISLQRKFGISYLFITHDLYLAKAIADRVAVMYQGTIVEEGKRVLDDPYHPYTKMLVESKIPESISGEMRNLRNMLRNNSCRFYDFCPERNESCRKAVEMVRVNGRAVRCRIYARK